MQDKLKFVLQECLRGQISLDFAYNDYMPTVFQVETECALCGTISEQSVAGPVERHGLPDLDTRPPEEVRSTLPYWIQACPNCGYCAPNIDLDYPLADSVIHQESYQALLRRRSLPQAARRFMAWAQIQASNDEHTGAGWSALHAAWACDDAGKPGPAASCRLSALEHFENARRGRPSLPGFEEAGTGEILLADLCRRADQFGRTVEISRQGLAAHPTEVVVRTLEREIVLALAGDNAAHSLAEVAEVE